MTMSAFIKTEEKWAVHDALKLSSQHFWKRFGHVTDLADLDPETQFNADPNQDSPSMLVGVLTVLWLQEDTV